MPGNERLRRHRIERNWRQQEVADELGTALVTYQRWEQGKQQPSAYYRVKLCALFGKSAQDLGLLEESSLSAPTEQEVTDAGLANATPSAPIALWTMPHARNPHFTGRDDLLEQITQHFSPQDTALTSLRLAALTQSYAIKGLGGVGKTQIAVEYAYRSQEQGRYTHTIWLNAASEEAILTSFVALADLLPNVVSRSETDQRKLVASVIRWLEQCEQSWLLLVDNADDLSFVPVYLPTRGNGRILFTTRTSAVGSLASSIEVDSMGLMEGTQLILRRAQREATATDEEIDEATNIAIALAQFPLALDQAGAYIEETGCSLHDYLQLYEQHRYALLSRRGRQARNYPESVATTWSLSFQRVEQTNPAAAELLHLCAFLAPDHIPQELLTEGAAYWPSMLQQAVADPLAFNQALETLLAYSLVKRLGEDRQLSMHRLVQVVQLEQLSADEQRQWAERIVRAMHTIFPRDPRYAPASWSQCLRYLEQVQACDTLIQLHELLLPEAAEVLTWAGEYLLANALFTPAELLYQHALRILEMHLGSEHLDVSAPLSGLANLYFEQGKYTEAEPLYQRALRIREQQLGSEHPFTATSLNNLALLYYKQGKYAEAEPLYQRALRIREQHLEPGHPNIAQSLNNLANLYKAQGKFAEAEPLYRQTLSIWEQQPDSEHPHMVHPLNNLANLYLKQGKFAKAEPLYQQALRIWERQLGLDHPQVAYLISNLALFYDNWGKYAEAEPLFQQALRTFEQQIGPEHPTTANHLINMAVSYSEQGKYAEAEPLFQRALHTLEQRLGPERPQVAIPLHGLAELYLKQGKYVEAEPLSRRALHIVEQQLGPEHPNVAYPLNNLANLYAEQGKYAEAEPLFQRAMSIREQQLGPEHPDTSETMHDLAKLWEAQGNRDKARALYTSALTIREQVFGVNHPKTRETRARLIDLLHAIEQHEEAELLEVLQSEYV